MPAPLVGRKFGVNIIPVPDRSNCQNIRVLGLSGSSRQDPGMSKSERLLDRALGQFGSYGCTTRLVRLNDLILYECEGNYSENPSYCHLSLPELDEVR